MDIVQIRLMDRRHFTMVWMLVHQRVLRFMRRMAVKLLGHITVPVPEIGLELTMEMACIRYTCIVQLYWYHRDNRYRKER